ncbi:uncharacterized protein LOC130717262 [Lotus japonicus]|uniref:uncharacterized protein LOC130717262 n=1 Tax=Lotus japonicus TaxID=34305 RepID=UPI002587831B|nr:uncharacterized protein LOC130717262 [Lotus japonicus]
MDSSSSSRSGRSNERVLRSLSTTASSKFCYYSATTSNAPFRSTSNSSSGKFSSSPSSSTYFNQHRSTSPTRVNLGKGASTALSSSVRFAIDNRSGSPNRTASSHVITSNNNRHQHNHGHHTIQKRTCMCSPTNHPGSFRCSLHKNSGNGNNNSNQSTDSYLPNRLNMRRSAMKNSLVRIGGVEGDWVKRALTALIRPSSHQQRRRAAFSPRPSRLSVMSCAAEEDL